jgi:hypothetical protein
MDFTTIRRGTSAASNDLDKQALVGQIIIAVESDYNPAMTTTYGESAAWDGTVIVVTGDQEGLYQEVRFFGLLAKQLHRQTEDGTPTVLKVVSGKSNRPGASDWIGVSEQVTDAEFDLAAAAAKKYSSGPRKLPF